MRSLKDEEEIAAIRKAQSITDAAFLEILDFIKPGKTEKEVAAYLEYCMRRLGADGLAFETIAAGGPNSAKPHAVPGDRPLRQGDFFTMDYGAYWGGYCSDMTRTFFCETADPDYAAIHDLVRSANEKAESLIRPGVRFCDLDKAARDVISEAGYGEYFTHRLGHSIGMQAHEAGDVSQGNPAEIQEGMTFSIEPGVYLPGKFGVRVEDLVLVTADGCEVLNHADKHWKVIG